MLAVAGSPFNGSPFKGSPFTRAGSHDEFMCGGMWAIHRESHSNMPTVVHGLMPPQGGSGSLFSLI
eukprot:8324545-Karenia_brevis.AAC.1